MKDENVAPSRQTIAELARLAVAPRVSRRILNSGLFALPGTSNRGGVGMAYADEFGSVKSGAKFLAMSHRRTQNYTE